MIGNQTVWRPECLNLYERTERPQPKREINEGCCLRGLALILRDEKVLICQRRPDQPMALKWEFPGGKVENGESAEQALRRELDEELGIAADIGNRVADPPDPPVAEALSICSFFVVHQFAGEMTNRIFHDLRWFRPLPPRYHFLAADRTLIRELAAGKLL